MKTWDNYDCHRLLARVVADSKSKYYLRRLNILFGLDVLQGKTVQIRRGSAAVTGDKCRNMSLFYKWEDAVIWLIRKPEDLPMNMMQCKAIKENSNASLITDGIRHPRTFPGSGIFAFRGK